MSDEIPVTPLHALPGELEAEAASIRNPYECDPPEMLREVAARIRASLAAAAPVTAEELAREMYGAARGKLSEGIPWPPVLEWDELDDDWRDAWTAAVLVALAHAACTSRGEWEELRYRVQAAAELKVLRARYTALAESLGALAAERNILRGRNAVLEAERDRLYAREAGARPAAGGDVIAHDMAHGDEGPALEADDDD